MFSSLLILFYFECFFSSYGFLETLSVDTPFSFNVCWDLFWNISAMISIFLCWSNDDNIKIIFIFSKFRYFRRNDEINLLYNCEIWAKFFVLLVLVTQKLNVKFNLVVITPASDCRLNDRISSMCVRAFVIF